MSHFVSVDIDRSLFFESVEMGKAAVVGVGRREDVDALEEIESEEEQEEAYYGQHTYFYFTFVFHIKLIF